jgi:hypothetical protein
MCPVRGTEKSDAGLVLFAECQFHRYFSELVVVSFIVG